MIRRLYFIIIMALMVLTGFAQPQPQTGDIIYVYQKDGEILPFLRSEIQEFVYSMEDEEGVTHNEPVMQWIVMEDSICKIPLANIDSISFVTPQTVYQPGVIRLEEGLMDYVVSSDGLTIELAANTPQTLMPKVGDKLVTTVQNDRLPAGFIGKVSEVSGTTVKCDEIGLEEVFVTYYNVYAGADEFLEESEAAGSPGYYRAIKKEENGDFVIKPKAKNFDKTSEMMTIIDTDDFEVQGQGRLKLYYQPVFTIKKPSVLLSPEHGARFITSIVADYDMKSEFSIYGKAEWTPEWPIKDIPLGVIPIPDFPFFIIYLSPGAYANVSGEITTSATCSMKGQVTTNLNIGFGGKQQKKPMVSTKVSEFDIKADSVSLKGSVEVGPMVDLGICFVKSDNAKVSLHYKTGPELSSSFVFHPADVANAKTSTALYDQLKDVLIDAKWNNNLTIEYLLSEEIVKIDDFEGTLFTLLEDAKADLRSFHVVPSFRSPSFDQNYSPRTSANAFIGFTAEPTCLMPVETGLQVSDADGQKVSEWTSDTKVGVKDFIGSMKHQFNNLDMTKDYRLNPKVKVMGIEMLASPSKELEKNDFPVRIVSFEQTGSHYSKQQGYVYDDIHYFYKFNATTTVELDPDAKNIKDWGYIYHDFYEVDKKISCANLGSNPYADLRYAYYYNGPERTVNLRPYVQLEGENEIKTGKPKIFEVEYTHRIEPTCPDNNHPHLIDLGLPSGTLWACCNVGAFEPEEEGAVFFRGSTVPLPSSLHYNRVELDTVYNQPYYVTIHEVKTRSGWPELTEVDNYREYFYPELSETDSIIPKSRLYIKGSQYDAATKYWGSGYSTPSNQEIRELVDNCKVAYVGGPYYGVCFKFTGPNGNSILLPAFERTVTDITETVNEDYYYNPGWWNKSKLIYKNGETYYNQDYIHEGIYMNSTYSVETDESPLRSLDNYFQWEYQRYPSGFTNSFYYNFGIYNEAEFESLKRQYSEYRSGECEWWNTKVGCAAAVRPVATQKATPK